MSKYMHLKPTLALMLAALLAGCAEEPSPENAQMTSSQVTLAEAALSQTIVDTGLTSANASTEIQLGDVMMRSLRVWPQRNNPNDTLATAKQFKVDHIVWIYENTEEFNEEVRAAGMGIGSTMAANAREMWQPNMSRAEALQLVDRFTIRNLHGEQTMQQHFRRFGDHLVTHFAPCQADPEWLDFYVDYLEMHYNRGIGTIHRDDPATSYAAVRAGGPFTVNTIRFFREYLAENYTPGELADLGVEDVATFDVRQHFLDLGAPSDNTLWQWRGSPLMPVFIAAMMEVDRQFFLKAKERVEARTGMRIPWSLNGGGPLRPLEDAFDFRISEFQRHHNQPQTLLEMSDYPLQAGKTQAWVSIVDREYATSPDFTIDLRRHIATAYAVGTIPLVPWCMYMHDAPRYYGSFEDYGDLFHFLSDNRQHFDGHTFSSVSGMDAGSRLYAWLPNREIRFRHASVDSPLRINQAGIFGFIRHSADASSAAIHLVDWTDDVQAFDISFPPSAVLRAEAARLTLLRPGQPEQVIASHYQGQTVTIPAIAPWGLLLVEPVESAAGGIPAPALKSPASKVTAAGVEIHFAAPPAGKTVMYRLTNDPQSSADDFVPYVANEPVRINNRGYIQAYHENEATGERSEVMTSSHLVYRDFTVAEEDMPGEGSDVSGLIRATAGEMKLNESFFGGAPRLLGERIDKAVSTQGNARLVLDVQPEWQYFSVDVGIDDAEDRRPSARFQVWLNDQLAYESRIYNPSKLILSDEDRVVFPIRVAIPQGTNRIQLRVIPNGFFHDQNSAVWANPTVF
jgi:hypothetical protein